MAVTKTFDDSRIDFPKNYPQLVCDTLVKKNCPMMYKNFPPGLIINALCYIIPPPFAHRDPTSEYNRKRNGKAEQDPRQSLHCS